MQSSDDPQLLTDRQSQLTLTTPRGRGFTRKNKIVDVPIISTSSNNVLLDQAGNLIWRWQMAVFYIVFTSFYAGA